MRIALIADVHGNLPALEAVFRDIDSKGIDAVYCLGDTLGKGPDGERAHRAVASRCEVMIAGNWDARIADPRIRASRFLPGISEETLRAVRALPFEHRLSLSGRRIRLIHGRPLMRELARPEWDRERLVPLFQADGERFDVVGYADTHMQGLRAIKRVGVLFNTGSVGNPLGDTRACYAVLTGELGEAPAPFEIAFASVEYDRERAVRDALERPELPDRDAYIREIRTGEYSR